LTKHEEIIDLLKQILDSETLQSGDIKMVRANLEFINKIRKIHLFALKFKLYYAIVLIALSGGGLTIKELIYSLVK
jgi:hypothetical protein